MNDPDTLHSDIWPDVDPGHGGPVHIHDDPGRHVGTVGRPHCSVQPAGPDVKCGPDVEDSGNFAQSGCADDLDQSTASLKEALEDSNSGLSDVSEVSGFSEMSGKNWKPHAGPMSWIHRQMIQGANPRHILAQLLPMNSGIPMEIDDISLWKLIIEILAEPPRRRRLRHINTLEDVVRLIRCSKKIMIVTGAGVSVSCGIPDFRSRDGLYSRLSVDFPSLPDPQAMFDIHYFDQDPRPFFKFAREIYPGQFQPSPAHRFIRLVEKHGKLLRNYSQNIDTLEQEAGIENVIQCHGSFATATCMRCKYKVDAEAIRQDIFDQKIPVCPICRPSGVLEDPEPEQERKPPNAEFSPSSSEEDAPDSVGPAVPVDDEVSNLTSATDESSQSSSVCQINGESSDSSGDSDYDPDARRRNPAPILKPDIVFFGEGLPEKFHTSMAADKDECDLLIVIGSSLKVRPVALIPSSVPHSVPLILINRESLSHVTFDVQLLGDCDVICNELCRRLGDDWTAPGLDKPALEEVKFKALTKENEDAEGEGSGGGPKGDPKSEHDVEALRKCWQPKVKESVAQKLPDGSFLHIPPNRYVFKGAEVYYDPDDVSSGGDDDDDTSNSSSSTSGSGTSSPVNGDGDENDAEVEAEAENGEVEDEEEEEEEAQETFAVRKRPISLEVEDEEGETSAKVQRVDEI